jgi:phage-related protein
MREQFEKSESASKMARKAARLAKKTRKRLEKLQRHRATFIEYALQRIEDEDWHGLSDVANDLRELDVEIRMTEAATL